MSGTDYTTTPNLGLYKPVYDQDAEAWGTHLNANADVLDGALATSGASAKFLPLSGGTMLGSLTLAADPSTALGAVTKQYADAHLFTDAANDANTYGRHANGWGAVVPLSGAAMTGLLTLSGAPSATLHAANKGYVDTFLPLTGGTMTGPLTLSANPTTALMAANKSYVDAAVGSGASANNTGRNYIQNPRMYIAQRGAGPFTAAGYTLDRWTMFPNLDTASVTQAALNDAQRAQIGDEDAFWCLQTNFTGNAGAAASTNVIQRMEHVRRLSNQTITISFYANANAALKLGLNVVQSFGTGGSPSAAVTVLSPGAQFTLSTTFTRYSVTVAMPSLAGKTFGTNNDDFTSVQFWYSSGATNNSQAGNIGVQSGAIAIFGVQVELGSVATPLDRSDVDWQNCQRHYQRSQLVLTGYALAGQNIFFSSNLPVLMRGSAPAVTPASVGLTNCGTLTAGTYGVTTVWIGVVVTATGTFAATVSYTASAEL
jgi:hypothetical protein